MRVLQPVALMQDSQNRLLRLGSCGCFKGRLWGWGWSEGGGEYMWNIYQLAHDILHKVGIQFKEPATDATNVHRSHSSLPLQLC